MSGPSTVQLVIRCHCGHFDTTTHIPAISLPLKSAICHCNSCKHVTGQIFTTHAVMPLPTPPDEISKLTEYASSARLRRYFCPKCGANVINVEQTEWEYATGCIRSIAGEFLGGKLDRVQLFLNDSKDGGAGIWINGGTNRAPPMKRYLQHRHDSEILSDEMLFEMTEKTRANIADLVAKNALDSTPLKAHCHCRSITFNLTRPSPSKRIVAGLCACYSCATSAGFGVTSWTRSPVSSIRASNGSPFSLDNPNMTVYHTTPGMDRYFCKTCGAKVFCKRDGDDTIDTAAGLFDAAEGHRAESWLEWTMYPDGVQYPEDCTDKPFVQLLTKGIFKDRDREK